MITAPTLLRAIHEGDPRSSRLEERGAAGGLKRLRALFLAGKRSEPSLVNMYTDILAEYGAAGAMVIDN